MTITPRRTAQLAVMLPSRSAQLFAQPRHHWGVVRDFRAFCQVRRSPSECGDGLTRAFRPVATGPPFLHAGGSIEIRAELQASDIGPERRASARRTASRVDMVLSWGATGDRDGHGGSPADRGRRSALGAVITAEKMRRSTRRPQLHRPDLAQPGGAKYGRSATGYPALCSSSDAPPLQRLFKGTARTCGTAPASPLLGDRPDARTRRIQETGCAHAFRPNWASWEVKP